DRAAEPGQVALEGGDRRTRLLVAPERVAEAVRRQHAAALGREDCQQAANLRSAQRDRGPRALHRDRSPDTDGQRHHLKLARVTCEVLKNGWKSTAPRCKTATARPHRPGATLTESTPHRETRLTMPLVNVKLIKGVFDDNEKQQMISKLTETMVGI